MNQTPRPDELEPDAEPQGHAPEVGATAAPGPVSPTSTSPGQVRRAILAASLAFALGWAANVAWSWGAPFRLVDRIDGAVSVVNATGGALCLDPAGGGRQRCGLVYQRLDAPPPALGQHVTVSVGVLRIAEDTEMEIFVLESAR